MTIFFTQISRAGAKKICEAPSNFLNIPKPFSQIKKSLRLAAALLSFGLFAASASGQVTITTPGATTLNEPGVIIYSVVFSTAQTGVSASNFNVTGTSTTQFAIGVTGSGTSYTVGLTVSAGARSSGTVILNMVNSTGISPGVSGLPVSGPAIQVNYPAPGATLTLTSTNANPGYAKTGDQLNYTLTTNGYNINYAIIAAGGNQVYNSGTQLPSTSGSLTLGSGTPQGAIAYDFTCDYTIGQTAGVFGGSGTSGIIFDSQPPTASIGAPSFTIVGNSGTSSVSYNVNYSDANFGSSNLTASGITLNTTGTASGAVSVTGSSTSYIVTISHILGAGTLGISVAGGYATDLAGNTDTGAGASQTVNVSGAILPAISSVSPASGPVGTLVTISGTNLATPAALTIGGVPAIVISDDGSTLVGMVMPGAVAGPVSFTNNGGTAGGAGNFMVTPTLYPSLQQGPKLVGTGSVGNAEQGITVAVSADGNTAIVGGNFDNSSHGAAWVYTRSGGMWTQQGSKLLGNDAVGSAPNEGISVAISADGNTAIVGGFGDNNNQGAAWVYTRSGGTWTQQGPKLVGTGVVGSYGAAQGYSVAISADGNTAAVGGYYDNSGVGAVWVYTRSGGTWTQQGAKLVGTGSAGSNVFQGWSVSLSADGNTIIAGGDADNSNVGAAWIYTRSGGVWTQQGAKLVGTGVVGNSTQGFSVSLSADGNTAIVGGKGDNTSVGAAWVYTRSGGVWSQQGSKLVGTGAVGAAEQGVSVSLTADGNTAMVGGWFDNNSQGAAWVYTRSGGVWTQQGAKLVGTGGIGSYFEQGSSVSLSADGNTVMAGGFGDNNSLGAAWAYISLQTPTVQAGSVTFTNTGTLTTTASWTNGNGSSRAVFMYAGSSGSPAPVNKTAYNANAAFGLGDQIGSTGWYCVYNGTGSTVNITGLTAGATYQLMVVEYNGSGSNVAYLSATGTGNPAAVTTLPPPPPTIASFTPATGPVGTLVTIIGTNLAAPTAFTIGGVPAIVVSNNGSTLVGMVMPGAATGTLSFTTAGGTTAGSGNFTVTATLYPLLQQGPKLVGTGNTGNAGQGYSVAVSADGNTAIVGGFQDNSGMGAVWVYTRSGGMWSQQGSTLVGTGAVGNAGQGGSVAISADGNTVIVGGAGDNMGQGAAWVYTRNGGTWTQQGSKLVGTGAVGGVIQQGFSVSLSADGNTAIVGVPFDNNGLGAAWVYTRNAAGIWTQQGSKLVGTGAVGNAGQGSSVSISADGNTAIAGAFGDNGSQGAAWVYTRSGGTWTQQGAKLVGTGAVGNAGQGSSVSLSADGNTAIVGGPHDNTQGAAWVFTRSSGVWTQQGSKLVGTDATGGANTGNSVSLSADGNTAMVSGQFDNQGQGAVWVYIRSGGTWTQQGSKLVGTGAAGTAHTGNSVSLSADGNTAMAGGIGDNNNMGAAWVYISLATPTVQADNVTFTNTTTLGTTATWTNGNGSSRAVFMYTGSSGSPAPVNNTAYNANAAFGIGDQVGSSGWYCVYNGTGNTVNITGLTAGTTYRVMVVEYNGSGSNVAYLSTAGTGNPATVTTLLPQPPTITSFTPASGPVGTLVTINGTNLYTPTAFTIGGAPAVVVSNDGSTLVGMVVPGAATGPLTFTTAGGTAAGGAGNFTVTATLYPSLQQGLKLVGTGAAGAYTNQGRSVAVSADGNTAIVGGWQDNNNVGAAWVYTRTGGVWTQQGTKLVGTGAGGNAGQAMSVSISADGNTAIVGGPQDNAVVGAAWVYTRTGGTWTQQGSKLVGTGSTGGAQQGSSVSLSADGNTAIVGGRFDNNGQGAVWVYTRTGGVWKQQGSKLVGTSPVYNAGQGASVSLSADGNTAIVGGSSDNAGVGAVWIYTRSGTTWTQQGPKLVSTDAAGSASQGSSVSLSADGNTAIVGGSFDNNSHGAAWVYTRSAGVWTQQGSKLAGTDATTIANIGASVSLSADGNTAILGGYSDNSGAGATWVYTRSGGVWTQQGSKLVGTGAAGNAGQGGAVSLSADGNTAMAGGFNDNNGLGTAWAYIAVPPPTIQAGGVTFTNTTTFATTAKWTNGNGSSRAIFMFAGSSGSPAPVNNTAYNANAVFGTGDQVGSTGWYCVYNGTGNTVKITGLTAATTYRLMVVEYNGSGGNVKYLTTAGTGNPVAVTTLPPQPPTIASFTPASGPVGTLVTITGTNLSAPTGFTIGGVPAIVVSDVDTALVGMVMPGAANAPVSMTAAGGTAAGGTNFRVTATLYPSLQQGSKLVGTGNAGSSRQGASVAISADGNTAIVGGPSDNASAGAVWIYIRSGGVWTQQGPKLEDNNNVGPYGSVQGNSVALSADGNTALAGGYNAAGAGAVWVYTRSGGTWTQQGSPLVGTDALAGSYSGASVSLSADGNTAIAGDYGGYSYYHGAAWIYTRSGGTWTQQGPKLVFTDAAVNSGQGSSVSLSADGNTAIVGGYADNSSQGAAWVFSRSGSVWTQQGSKLVGTGAVGPAAQGTSVSLSADGNTAVIGGAYDNSYKGATWVYTRSAGVWTQQGLKLVGNGAAGKAEQGFSVSLSADGNTAVIGGAYDNSNKGAAWVYTRSSGVWTQRGPKLVGTDATSGANIGSSVSLSADGNTAIAGGFGDNNSLGAAWAYISLQAPTAQAGNVTFNGTTSTATTASWTNGNGASRAVFMFAGSSGSPAPVNNTAYNANAAFGAGDQIGSTGWYCVYSGTGNTVNITGLTAGTTYLLMVIEYNSTGSNIKYLTTKSTGNPASVTSLSANTNLIGLSISTGTLSPVFATATTSYTASVGNAISFLTVTPTTADPNASVKVNGVAVVSGTASGAISLNVGANAITTVVTAQNGTTTKTYTVTVTRAPSNNDNISSIRLIPSVTLTAVSGADYKDYTASVSNATSSIQVVPTTAVTTSTVTVNGVLVTSGSASGSILLNVGPNLITTVVTAQDGTSTHTYGITVTRAPSSDATLSNLVCSKGVLNPAFATATTSYLNYVPNITSDLTLTPTTTNSGATVTVNGTTVPSGTASGTIPLNVGNNIITIKVTAQDGVTTKTYTLTANRAPSSNDNLSAIRLIPSTVLTLVTGPDYKDYTASVTNATTSVQEVPTASVTTATITVNGVAVASGAISNAIPLNVGANTITTVVTAQDGVSTHTYVITVTRAAGPIANALNTSVSVSSPTDHPQMMGEEINVHQGLSPNGDGINDFLLVDGITNYPDNKLTIMNRSGQLIFEARGYDNSTKVFDGHSNKTGAMQLPGTYFYSLDFTVNGVTKHKTGFIILKY